ncbi:nuclease [Marinomonas sp. A3A]|uniref:NYN domain-containing protein n=1 Tax=Marinomonas sp. A3A TaxID=2065312 RepID=UPI001BB36F05|nr:NYN domain-containing protein [Marinomonas sp. A3A]QUX90324.1 nuclease [Marinomonas sp. A3A]
MDIKVAFLVDGSFFLKRLQFFKRKYYTTHPDLTANETVQILSLAIRRHLNNSSHGSYQHLYRVFYYDSPPLDIKAHYPLIEKGETNRRVIDFSKETNSIHRQEILDELKKQRKFALRLGTIKHDKQWKLTDSALNDLLQHKRQFDELTNADFYYSVRQKGVDIKLGVDVSTLAQQKLIDKIVLIAGDSDFVPAAKLARINGIDFVLDALRNNIDPTLHEHIDGLISYDLVSIMKDVLKKEPDSKPAWWNTGTNPQKPKYQKQKNDN